MATAAATSTAPRRARASKPVTKRREQTRQHLLAAALDVFAEDGFGRATVEQVCERAGYTRGAFYSNFSSLDELFLAMWQQRSQQMLADLAAALDGVAGTPPDKVIRSVLAAIPVDDAWYRVTAEFTAHALRNPKLRRVVAAREQAIHDTIVPIVEDALARTGRRVTDRSALGHALVAVHDGTTVQCLLEPGDADVARRREELFLNVLQAYSKEST
jgi:AcrR family transcriptional regulator